MRTEVKIGIVIGLAVLAGAIVLFLSQGKKSGELPDVVPLNKTGAATEAKPKPGEPAKPPAATPRQTAPKPGGTDKPAAPAPRTPAAATQPAATPHTPTSLPPRIETRTGPPAPAAEPPREPTASQPTPKPPVVERPPESRPIVTLPGPRPSEPPATRPAPPAAPPVAKPAPEKPAATRHTVAADETLWMIAQKYYGDGNLWPRIKAANPDIDENRIKVGQVLVIPPKEEAAPPAAKPKEPGKEAPSTKPEEPKVRKHTYVVEEGDTLRKIARNVLKDENRWREILELNRDKISNPDILLVGIELRLPEK